MAQELSFTLQAAVAGIGIVFAFLLLLSLLMVAIRGLVDLLPGGALSPAAAPAAAATAAPAPPSWVVAAAAAYLESEAKDEGLPARASVWVRRSNR